ncbi:protein EARLY RESPONSIVE TO DEHYDRATION 15-like protein [Carex littledalei]|uniref:Protein EARLY RESPONSIVE TO DEHYDRATION 15-like protein n=1 Tax=Carex littledalei TaxID=544730 RepID=A0A833VKS4_9POAL|nr:protein EARLY RESPONSIVE TO DEHYDRATION 15-like protein [Carex littledalei]
MEVISGRRVSGLNPYAAPFVPVAYRAVEDYSPEWWQLMETTPWFRDYWFSECFIDPEIVDNYEATLPDDIDSLFYPSHQEEKESREKKDKTGEEMVLWGLEKWRQSRGLAEVPRYVEKAPKFVNHRISPRTINQPK